MKTGQIIELVGCKGVVVAEQPSGLITCWFGGEMKRQEINIKPSKLALVDFIDLTPIECEVLLPLMQALVFRLKDNEIPF